jgi:peptidoglycan/xylan/chitin deacetylase (PgdA/CDA1 family)
VIKGLVPVALSSLVLTSCSSDQRPSSSGVARSDLRIAVTVDDLPFADRSANFSEVRRSTTRILSALKSNGAAAVGFVNEDRLADTGSCAAGVGILRQWLRAGNELGNHNYGHVGLQETPLAAYQEAVLKGERVTRAITRSARRPFRYYRHPFTQTGPSQEVRTAFENFLDEHGYEVAPFTIEHDDYLFSAVYDDALARRDFSEVERIRAAYLTHLDKSFAAFETMSSGLFNRQIPQVFLIHANRLNADMLDTMLRRIKQRGYRFISLETALQDPAYRSPDGYVGPSGPSWLMRWARGMRRRLPVYGQPDPEAWLRERYEAILARSRPEARSVECTP